MAFMNLGKTWSSTAPMSAVWPNYAMRTTKKEKNEKGK
jgi:hypothetical protein